MSRGDDHLFAVYWAKDAPDTVASFFREELPKQGWALESSDNVISDKKDDGTQDTMTVLTFVKDEQRITVGVAPNKNYPPNGQSHVGVTIQPR